MDFCYVMIGTLKKYQNNCLLPSFIKQELNRISNERIKNQKRASYGVLRALVHKELNFDDDFSSVQRNENGKPHCERYCFSISHSDELVAVAVSNSNVGIDIEKVKKRRNISSLQKIIVGQNEGECGALSLEDLIRLWVKKEAKFKFDGGKTFIPNQIDTTTFPSFTNQVHYDHSDYFVCVVTGQKNVKFELDF